MGVSRNAVQKVLGIFGTTALILGVAVPLATTGPAAAASTYQLNQCRNGKLGSPVVCNNTSSSYQNGDDGAENSHFREGDFVPFNLIVTNLTAGQHELQIQYQVTDSNKHAYDYLGSYDTTETTGSPASGSLFADHNNPCDNLTLATSCTPGSPSAQIAIPAPDLSGSNSADCGGSGTAPASPNLGFFKMFGAPASSTLDTFTYPTQNSGSGGGCISVADIKFTLGSDLGANSLVFAWGGHIASQADWGPGTSASFINGAPYHMWINSMDGSGGSQERSLKTSAVFFSPSVSTQIETYPGGTVIAGTPPTVLAGSQVQDTATITGASGNEGGGLTYLLFNNDTCTAGTNNVNVLHETDVTVSGGVVPPSDPFTTPLAGGSFSFQATYNGDGGSNLASPAGACEPLHTTLPKPTVTTAVYTSDNSLVDPATALPLGTQVHDTTTITGGSSPSGTVTYKLYSGTCAAQVSATLLTTETTATFAAGATPPNSSDSDPLGAGNYFYLVSYNGDSDNQANTADCEPFSVDQAQITVSTTVKDVANDQTWSTVDPAPAVGSAAYDTTTLTGFVSGVPITGNVTYTLFTDPQGTSGCQGDGVVFDTVAVNSDGTVPHSKSTGPLGAGNYGFEAQYTDDANYKTSPVGDCEPFSVAAVPLTPLTSPTTGTGVTGAMVFDTSSLPHQVDGFVATGTVTYTLYRGTCETGTQVGSPSVKTIDSSGNVPNSANFGPLGAGDYYFIATFQPGDANYVQGAQSDCEPFTLDSVPLTPHTTPDTGTGEVGALVFDTATLPGQVDFVPATGTVTYTLFAGTCETGTQVGSPSVKTIDSSGKVPNSDNFGPLATGAYYFVATFTPGDNNYTAGDQSDCEPFTLTTPNFRVLKTDVPGDGQPVTPGSTIPYTVTIDNLGNGAGSATIGDPIPSSLTVQGTPACSVPQGDTCTPSLSGNTLTVDVTLAAGDTATVTFSAVLAKTDTADVVNTATITEGICDNGQVPSVVTRAAVNNCSSTVTNPVPDFTVTKTDGPGDNTPVAPGSTIPYTVAIKNVGDGAGSAVITDPLPSSVTAQGSPSCSAPSGDTCTAALSGSTVTVHVMLAAGDTATVTFSAVVAASATGTISNTATITTGPCNTSSGCSSSVSNPVPVVAPTTTTTAPPAAKPAAIAFTGADIAAMFASALALLGLGSFLVLISRRRRRSDTPANA